MNMNRKRFFGALVAASSECITSSSVVSATAAMTRGAPSILLRRGLTSVNLIRAAVISSAAIPIQSNANPLALVLAFLGVVGAHRLSGEVAGAGNSAFEFSNGMGEASFHDETRTKLVFVEELRRDEVDNSSATPLNTADGYVNLGYSAYGDMNEWEMALFSAYAFPKPVNSSLRHKPSEAAAKVIADAWGAMIGQPLHHRQVAAARWWKTTDQRIVTALSNPLPNGQVLAVAIDGDSGKVMPLRNGQG